ncbi:GNAT family N-acetyltransferase [Chamaesiphon minutus]|uniref:Acetyltransferase n=1 Tax=Chamaesiphon minutus (strain ATCC 27169 / PCC 6605) TaxID=1173020 RepID=K9UNS5_CHAP6|nr:GNAT family N-acetyltransferase [Chamaesiphon minutus]AFY96475.1 acetyltransferase [Chamaesiphon minutus PCC 6605]
MEIRFLNSQDVTAYYALRLQALQESPTAFGSSYEQEACLPMADFAARVCPADSINGIFGAFDDTNDRLIGMLGFSRESRLKRAHIGNLWSMYVVPEFRSRGLGSALLDAALSHAKGLGVLRQIVLGVTANNLAASSLYKSRGFQPFGFERDALFVDGVYFDEEHLVLHFDRCD